MRPFIFMLVLTLFAAPAAATSLPAASSLLLLTELPPGAQRVLDVPALSAPLPALVERLTLTSCAPQARETLVWMGEDRAGQARVYRELVAAFRDAPRAYRELYAQEGGILGVVVWQDRWYVLLTTFSDVGMSLGVCRTLDAPDFRRR